MCRANPYLPKENLIKQYTETIEPRKIADSLLKIRTQLAQEFVEDLSLISSENDQTLVRYKQRAKTEDQERKDKMKRGLEGQSEEEWEKTQLKKAFFDVDNKGV